MKIFKFKNLRLRKSLYATPFVLLPTVFLVSACGETDQNKIIIYSNLKTSIDDFYKKTFKPYQDKHSSKGFMDWYSDPANNDSNKYQFEYLVSSMLSTPGFALNNLFAQKIANNANFFDATQSWNGNVFISLWKGVIINYLSIFYLTAFSYLHQDKAALNDLNNGSKLGSSSAFGAYLNYLNKNRIISLSDYNFWILQARNVFNQENKAKCFLYSAITSGFNNFDIDLPAPSSNVQPDANFVYSFRTLMLGNVVNLTANVTYDSTKKTYLVGNSLFTLTNGTNFSTDSALNTSLKLQDAANGLWVSWKTYSKANPSNTFLDYLDTSGGQNAISDQAKTIFNDGTSGWAWSNFVTEMQTQAKSNNFTYTGSGWTNTQKEYLGQALANQMLGWAETAVFMEMSYQYNLQNTIAATQTPLFQSDSLYGSYFLWQTKNNFFQSPSTGKLTDTNLNKLFKDNLQTIFSSNDYSSLTGVNYLFFMLMSNNFQDVKISSSTPIAKSFASGTTIDNFTIALAFNNKDNTGDNKILNLQYTTTIDITSGTSIVLKNINNFLTL